MANRVGPIKPNDVSEGKEKTFPDAVFESFNELIIQKIVGSSVTILQEDVVDLMIEKGLSREEIYEKGWLNIEEVYRSVGWKVFYDRPAYNESYPPSFQFDRSKK